MPINNVHSGSALIAYAEAIYTDISSIMPDMVTIKHALANAADNPISLEEASTLEYRTGRAVTRIEEIRESMVQMLRTVEYFSKSLPQSSVAGFLEAIIEPSLSKAGLRKAIMNSAKVRDGSIRIEDLDGPVEEFIHECLTNMQRG